MEHRWVIRDARADDAIKHHSRRVENSTTTARDMRRRGISFGPAARAERTGDQYPHPIRPQAREKGATQCVTPRQTCPRPNGFGRNLRSKTRWFTGFCNSPHVSHFATFFIDARAEISVAESRLDIQDTSGAPAHFANEATGGRRFVEFSLARSAPGYVSPHKTQFRAHWRGRDGSAWAFAPTQPSPSF